MTTIAIIGAGTIGAIHAAAYQSVNADLVAVVEPAEAAARAFSERFGVRNYAGLTELLESEDRPDAVSICAPPFTHRALVETALVAGLHVLCEKPMAHTLQDAEAIARAAAASSCVFATAYCHRFQPEVEAMVALIESGRIGAVRAFYNIFTGYQPQIEKTWFGSKALAGGGVLIDTAIHSIDLFRYLCGEVVDSAAVMTSTLDGVELEVEHTAALALRSEAGVVGTIDCSWKTANARAVVRVSGSAGSLHFDYSKPGILVFEDPEGAVEHIPATGQSRFSREVAAFLDAIGTGTEPRTGAIDGLVGVATVDAAYRRCNVPPASRVGVEA